MDGLERRGDGRGGEGMEIEMVCELKCLMALLYYSLQNCRGEFIPSSAAEKR